MATGSKAGKVVVARAVAAHLGWLLERHRAGYALPALAAQLSERVDAPVSVKALQRALYRELGHGISKEHPPKRPRGPGAQRERREDLKSGGTAPGQAGNANTATADASSAPRPAQSPSSGSPPRKPGKRSAAALLIDQSRELVNLPGSPAKSKRG